MDINRNNVNSNNNNSNVSINPLLPVTLQKVAVPTKVDVPTQNSKATKEKEISSPPKAKSAETTSTAKSYPGLNSAEAKELNDFRALGQTINGNNNEPRKFHKEMRTIDDPKSSPEALRAVLKDAKEFIKNNDRLWSQETRAEINSHRKDCLEKLKTTSGFDPTMKMFLTGSGSPSQQLTAIREAQAFAKTQNIALPDYNITITHKLTCENEPKKELEKIAQIKATGKALEKPALPSFPPIGMMVVKDLFSAFTSKTNNEKDNFDLLKQFLPETKETSKPSFGPPSTDSIGRNFKAEWKPTPAEIQSAHVNIVEFSKSQGVEPKELAKHIQVLAKVFPNSSPAELRQIYMRLNNYSNHCGIDKNVMYNNIEAGQKVGSKIVNNQIDTKNGHPVEDLIHLEFFLKAHAAKQDQLSLTGMTKIPDPNGLIAKFCVNCQGKLDGKDISPYAQKSSHYPEKSDGNRAGPLKAGDEFIAFSADAVNQAKNKGKVHDFSSGSGTAIGIDASDKKGGLGLSGTNNQSFVVTPMQEKTYDKAGKESGTVQSIAITTQNFSTASPAQGGMTNRGFLQKILNKPATKTSAQNPTGPALPELSESKLDHDIARSVKDLKLLKGSEKGLSEEHAAKLKESYKNLEATKKSGSDYGLQEIKTHLDLMASVPAIHPEQTVRVNTLRNQIAEHNKGYLSSSAEGNAALLPRSNEVILPALSHMLNDSTIFVDRSAKTAKSEKISEKTTANVEAAKKLVCDSEKNPHIGRLSDDFDILNMTADVKTIELELNKAINELTGTRKEAAIVRKNELIQMIKLADVLKKDNYHDNEVKELIRLRLIIKKLEMLKTAPKFLGIKTQPGSGSEFITEEERALMEGVLLDDKGVPFGNLRRPKGKGDGSTIAEQLDKLVAAEGGIPKFLNEYERSSWQTQQAGNSWSSTSCAMKHLLSTIRDYPDNAYTAGNDLKNEYNQLLVDKGYTDDGKALKSTLMVMMAFNMEMFENFENLPGLDKENGTLTLYRTENASGSARLATEGAKASHSHYVSASMIAPVVAEGTFAFEFKVPIHRCCVAPNNLISQLFNDYEKEIGCDLSGIKGEFMKQLELLPKEMSSNTALKGLGWSIKMEENLKNRNIRLLDKADKSYPDDIHIKHIRGELDKAKAKGNLREYSEISEMLVEYTFSWKDNIDEGKNLKGNVKPDDKVGNQLVANFEKFLSLNQLEDANEYAQELKMHLT